MRRGVFNGKNPLHVQSEMYYYARCDSEPATVFQGLRQPQGPNTSLGLDG